MKISLTPAGVEPATFLLIAQHLNHCATAVPLGQYNQPKFYTSLKVPYTIFEGEDIYTIYSTQKLYTVTSYLGVVYLLYMLYFTMSCMYCCQFMYCCQLSCVYCCSCLVCCCSCLVYIVAILCVLLYYVCIAVFYFGCRTAGQKSVLGRSYDRPPRHRFFLVSFCL